MTDAIRLSKYLTRRFTCSRREAELLIEGGWVMVDGEVVEEPQFKVLEQRVEIHPDAVAEPLEPATLLIHKPAGIDTASLVMSTLDMPHPVSIETRSPDDHTRIRPLKKHFSRLQALLPLETEASGLQVLTQDYRVERKLGEDGDRLEQEWIVETTGRIIEDGLNLLNGPLEFNGRPLPRAKVSWQNETRLRIALKNPPPGQIVHMCALAGLGVQSMKRIRIGRIPLAGLPPGQWRYVAPYERF